MGYVVVSQTSLIVHADVPYQHEIGPVETPKAMLSVTVLRGKLLNKRLNADWATPGKKGGDLRSSYGSNYLVFFYMIDGSFLLEL